MRDGSWTVVVAGTRPSRSGSGFGTLRFSPPSPFALMELLPVIEGIRKYPHEWRMGPPDGIINGWGPVW